MVAKHSFFQNSQCLNKFMHRFSIKQEWSDGVLEVCEICKCKQFFKVIDDKLNNADYMSYHFRNVLPPNHPFFYHENNYEPLTEIVSPYF